MGCFSTWFQVLPSRFLCSSRFSFFCRPEYSCEGFPTQAFGAFLRDVSQAPLPGLLEPSLTVQMYDVCSGLASYGSYVSDLVICVVMPFSSGLHVFTEFAFIDTWNFARAPSSHRGAEGRWRCWRLLVAFSGCLQQTLSLVPVQRQSNQLPATTAGECRRRHSLRRHKGGRWTVRLTSRHHVSQGGFSSVWCVLCGSGQSSSAGARGLRWLRWPRFRAGGRFNTTLRAGSLWWSSGGNTRDKRATPAGRPTHRLAGTVPRNGSHDRYPAWCAGYDGCWVTSPLVHVTAALRADGHPPRATVPRNGGFQPKDWRAPTQGLAGDIFLTRSGSTVCPNCSWLTCPRSYVEFYSGLGAWYSCAYLCTPGFFLFFSFVSASSFSVFGGFLSRSRLTATREVVRLPQELFSITALGRHFKVPLCHCWRAFRALQYGSSERVPASLSWDSRWKVAS